MVEAMKLVQHGSQTQPDTLKKGFAASTSTQTRALLDTDKIVLALLLVLGPLPFLNEREFISTQ